MEKNFKSFLDYFLIFDRKIKENFPEKDVKDYLEYFFKDKGYSDQIILNLSFLITKNLSFPSLRSSFFRILPEREYSKEERLDLVIKSLATIYYLVTVKGFHYVSSEHINRFINFYKEVDENGSTEIPELFNPFL